jgi:multidrug efflux pump subunit AcrB
LSRLTRFSLVNRLVVALVSIAIVAFGVIAVTSLKQELIPSATAPQAFISAIYPGVAPDIVADKVADPIEQSVRAVKGVTKVSSTSTTGSTQISAEWDFGLDNDKVLSDITTAVESTKSTLPDDIQTTVTAGSTDDIPVSQLAVASDLPLTQLGPIVEDQVVSRLESIEGVRQVDVSGEDTTRIEVTLDAKQLDKYDLTAAGVTQTLTAQLTSIPAGISYNGNSELSVEVGQTPDSVKTIKALTISTADDGPKRLDQLASVKISSVDRTSISRADGRPALGLGIL